MLFSIRKNGSEKVKEKAGVKERWKNYNFVHQIYTGNSYVFALCYDLEGKEKKRKEKKRKEKKRKEKKRKEKKRKEKKN
jgi:hypothetical protein